MLFVHVMTPKTLILLISTGPFHDLIRRNDRGGGLVGTNVS